MNKQIKMTASILTLITGLYGAEVLAEKVSDDYAGTLIVLNTAESSVSDRISSTEFASLEAAEKAPACQAIQGSFDYTGAQQVSCSADGSPKEAEWSYLY